MEPSLYLPSQQDSNNSSALTIVPKTESSTSKPFIEANTIQASLQEIKEHHIIPVFTRDNETLISHADFIEIAQQVVHKRFASERISSPSVRVSHPIKGRIPEARNKPASELEEWEKTLFYERMAFILEVPSITEMVGEENLSLTIGGVKCYNEDSMSSRKGVDQHFKIFIGFKVSVCTNLCVWTEGLVESVRVKSIEELHFAINHLVESFDAISSLQVMSALPQVKLREQQFANLIGRCKMYQHLPLSVKEDIPTLLFGDSHINTVCKDYYKDSSFCRDSDGDINLWKLYNLFTAINKGSYIDTFLGRAANASSFIGEIAYDLTNGRNNWFLS
jgi:hypothetical protein